MRDAFGVAFSIKLMLIFLMLYVAFICVALNYARAFRVKNRIINIIEQNEGYCDSTLSSNNNTTNIDAQINSYLQKAGYYVSYDDVKSVVGKVAGNDSIKYECLNGFENNSANYGYCIYNTKNTTVGKSCINSAVYTVETYMIFKLPIINIRFPIVIKGETRPVERLK